MLRTDQHSGTANQDKAAIPRRRHGQMRIKATRTLLVWFALASKPDLGLAATPKHASLA